MIIICKDNDGFSDQLTAPAQYNVKQIGVNSYLIENDLGQERWYGEMHFLILIQWAYG
jgi:galactose-1-phosphate uridylyltransferase